MPRKPAQPPESAGSSKQAGSSKPDRSPRPTKRPRAGRAAAMVVANEIAVPAPPADVAGAAPLSADPLNLQVRQRVRALRQAKGWTLDHLAALSGVSRSMLSQIERGGANPTLGVAFRVARALGLSLGDLVESAPSESPIDVVRAGDRSSLFRDDAQCRVRTLSPLRLEKDVEFYELTLKPGGVLDSAPHFAGAREFVTIESGAARVTSNQHAVELAAGDSAHYAADAPHRIENLASGETQAFLVVIYARR